MNSYAINKFRHQDNTSFSKQELIECGRGNLFGAGNARLPLPPFLMIDRITDISVGGGEYGKGFLSAELDINPSEWFFECHFHNDPVMPGSLGLEALWQLTGFHLAFQGYKGVGRVLNSGQTRFKKQITPDHNMISYHVNIRKIVKLNSVLAQSEGTVRIDGDLAYQATGIKVGLFQ